MNTSAFDLDRIPPDYLEWLSRQGVRDAFIDGIRTAPHHGTGRDRQSVEWLGEKFIVNAFRWGATPRNILWSDTDRRWRAYYGSRAWIKARRRAELDRRLDRVGLLEEFYTIVRDTTGLYSEGWNITINGGVLPDARPWREMKSHWNQLCIMVPMPHDRYRALKPDRRGLITERI